MDDQELHSLYASQSSNRDNYVAAQEKKAALNDRIEKNGSRSFARTERMAHDLSAAEDQSMQSISDYVKNDNKLMEASGELTKEQMAPFAELDKEFANDISGNTPTSPPPAPVPPIVPPVPTPIVQSYVASGAKMICPFAMGGTSALVVTPDRRTSMQGPPKANIMDNKPMVNIPTFGVCSSMANPQVAAATAAAMGVLTPQPCIPNIVAPWAPGKANLMVQGQPALQNTDTLQCLWGGVITIMPDPSTHTGSAPAKPPKAPKLTSGIVLWTASTSNNNGSNGENGGSNNDKPPKEPFSAINESVFKKYLPDFIKSGVNSNIYYFFGGRILDGLDDRITELKKESDALIKQAEEAEGKAMAASKEADSADFKKQEAKFDAAEADFKRQEAKLEAVNADIKKEGSLKAVNDINSTKEKVVGELKEQLRNVDIKEINKDINEITATVKKEKIAENLARKDIKAPIKNRGLGKGIKAVGIKGKKSFYYDAKQGIKMVNGIIKRLPSNKDINSLFEQIKDHKKNINILKKNINILKEIKEKTDIYERAANEARSQAAEQMQIAREKRAEAERQDEIAKEKRAEAERQDEIAKEKRAEAKKQEKIAKDKRERAKRLNDEIETRSKMAKKVERIKNKKPLGARTRTAATSITTKLKNASIKQDNKIFGGLIESKTTKLLTKAESALKTIPVKQVKRKATSAIGKTVVKAAIGKGVVGVVAKGASNGLGPALSLLMYQFEDTSNYAKTANEGWQRWDQANTIAEHLYAYSDVMSGTYKDLGLPDSVANFMAYATVRGYGDLATFGEQLGADIANSPRTREEAMERYDQAKREGKANSIVDDGIFMANYVGAAVTEATGIKGVGDTVNLVMRVGPGVIQMGKDTWDLTQEVGAKIEEKTQWGASLAEKHPAPMWLIDLADKIFL